MSAEQGHNQKTLRDYRVYQQQRACHHKKVTHNLTSKLGYTFKRNATLFFIAVLD
ncbi:hypothetical protein VHTUMSATKI_47130 [Vibrio harveyi]